MWKLIGLQCHLHVLWPPLECVNNARMNIAPSKLLDVGKRVDNERIRTKIKAKAEHSRFSDRSGIPPNRKARV